MHTANKENTKTLAKQNLPKEHNWGSFKLRIRAYLKVLKREYNIELGQRSTESKL